MRIKEMIQQAKSNVEFSKRRASAVAAHGRSVVAAGVGGAQTVVSVTVRSLRLALQTQVSTLTDSSRPLSHRMRKLKHGAGAALASVKADIVAAIKEGYQSVADKLVHVTSVSRLEQATENKISRATKKMKKTAARLATS